VNTCLGRSAGVTFETSRGSISLPKPLIKRRGPSGHHLRYGGCSQEALAIARCPRRSGPPTTPGVKRRVGRRLGSVAASRTTLHQPSSPVRPSGSYGAPAGHPFSQDARTIARIETKWGPGMTNGVAVESHFDGGRIGRAGPRGAKGPDRLHGLWERSRSTGQERAVIGTKVRQVALGAKAPRPPDGVFVSRPAGPSRVAGHPFRERSLGCRHSRREVSGRCRQSGQVVR
jgi:hypothetical protein